MTIHSYCLNTWNSWRIGFGACYSPRVMYDSAGRKRYFPGEIWIDLFLGPLTCGAGLAWGDDDAS